MEQAVVEEIQKLASDPRMKQLLEEESAKAADLVDGDLKVERAQLKLSLASFEQQFDRFTEVFKLTAIDVSELKRVNEKLRVERQNAENRLVEVERILDNRDHREAWAKRVREAILDFPRIWEHLDLEVRQGLLLELIEHMSVNRESKEKKEIILSLKLALLPQSDVVVRMFHRYRGRPKPAGVNGLTIRQLAYLHHVGQGLSTAEVGIQMGLTMNGLNWLIKEIRRHTGIRKMSEAAWLAKPRISKLLHKLPLGPRKTVEAKPQPGLSRETFPPKLMEVFPLLAGGATMAQAVQMTGLKKATIGYRRKRILALFGTDTIFEAGRHARSLGILD